MYFKENLRYLRVSNGETQRELAAKMGDSQAGVANYELGEREPSLEVVIQIAKHYNVTIDDLLNKRMHAEGTYLDENLCFLRDKKGMTREEMNKKLNIDLETSMLFETCLMKPQLAKLVEIARYFNVTLDELVTVNLKEAKR